MRTIPTFPPLSPAPDRPPRSASIPWIVVAAGLGLALALRSADAPRTDPPPRLPPIGSILAFGGPASTVPESEGWMLCDGRELPASSYPDLHRVLGDAWGSGRGSGTFRLPDLRGRFPRGVQYDADPALGDPDAATRMASAPGGRTGNEVGTYQEDTAGPHRHPLAGAGDAIGQGLGAEWIRFHALKVPDESAPVLTNTWAVQPGDSLETRPRNVAVNWIIRAR